MSKKKGTLTGKVKQGQEQGQYKKRTGEEVKDTDKEPERSRTTGN
jgi:hypothetical protein